MTSRAWIGRGGLLAVIWTGVLAIGARADIVGTQQDKLTANDAGMGDEFGYSCDIDGDTAVVGAPLDDDGGENAGAAYVFVRSGTTWTQQGKLTADDAAAGDRFGWSVAVSGDRIVVGAHLKDDGGMDSGAAYVFERSAMVWSQETRLPRNGAEANDNFGISVDIEGDYIIAAAYLDDLDPDDKLYIPVGSVMVYQRIANFWFAVDLLTADDGEAADRFGRSVSLSWPRAAVGAYDDDDNGNSSGSAYVFIDNGGGWSQEDKLTPGDADEGDWFGYSVDLAGNRLICGAPFDEPIGQAAGSAYVFRENANVWQEEQKLLATDRQPFDEFGFAVSISNFTAVIGARLDIEGVISSGSAYIFQRIGFFWTQSDKILPNDGDFNDEFGYCVSLDETATTAIIGARFNDDDGSDSGSAYVFDLELVPYMTFCTGDGEQADCPCDNSGALGRGCENSAGLGGVLMTAADQMPDGLGGGSIDILGTGFPVATMPTVLVIRSEIPFVNGIPFGDGLRCLGLPITRIIASTAGGGNVNIPLWHGAGFGVFYYQLWYRNSPPFCTANEFNLSNGIEIQWP